MTLQNPFSARCLRDDRKEPYLQIFLLGCVIFFLIAVPIMVITGGYFVFYGDFNSQQIPFYHLAHDAIRNGEIGWNWQTDLGANFIGSYSFYLLGSPFFWLSLLFPSAAVPYLIAPLLALKHGVAALTSYAFIRRFVRSRQAAMIGALLYAYSGFQMFNLFFNHFHDVTAFFPLLLIALEERVNNDRRGVFALCTGFMAMLNYYFFTGEVVFVILYFICRCPCKDFNVSLRKFFSIALESVIGVMLSAFMLLPSCLAILSNNRVGTYLTGMDMALFSDRTRIPRILLSFFMIPDSPARPNLFSSDYAKWASIGGYFPLFSMAGVISFMAQKRKHWATRLTAICIVCAFIPVFNSMFYTFNRDYYARWYFMPILIMALMTSYALDNRKIKWRGGVIVCGIMLLLFALVACFPTKDADDKLLFFQLPKYPWYFWLCFVICGGMLYLSAYFLMQRKKGIPYLTGALWSTVLCCLVCCGTMVYYGIGMSMYPTFYVNYAIEGGKDITLVEPEENQFFRVDISKDYDNYPMFWGYSNMRCFQSVVPTSIMDFYSEMGITRDVASRAEEKHFPLRGMFNVKYYFDKSYADQTKEYDFDCGMPGFQYLGKENSFYIYENEYYLPMGMAYDSYVSKESVKSLSGVSKEKVMLSALVMDDEQIEKYADTLDQMPAQKMYGIDEEQYLQTCEERRADCCDTFRYDSYGFEASIHLEKPEMVFFSVPAEDGWSAEVNGKPVEIELVNYGFMAVMGEAGANVITFHYETPGLRIGLILTAGGGFLLIVYLLIFAGKRRKTGAPIRHTHCYDYCSDESLPIHEMYLQYAASKNIYPPHSEPEKGEPESDVE